MLLKFHIVIYIFIFKNICVCILFCGIWMAFVNLKGFHMLCGNVFPPRD